MILPQQLPPGYDPITGQNTGDMGFQVGGGRKQYYDPNIAFQTPFAGGFLDVYKDFNADTNPGAYRFDPTQLTPTKITYDNQDRLGPVPQSLGGGQATQTLNGQQFNVGANNYAIGQSSATPTPFQSSNPSVGPREEAQTPFTGFGFGQVGQPGYKFMAGDFSSQAPGTQSQFFAQQPSSQTQTTPGLGIFKPWQDPALKALQMSRGNP